MSLYKDILLKDRIRT